MLSRRFRPVSYTHLDVYKRQGMSLSQDMLTTIKKEDFIMAYVITDTCVSCGSCASECPVGAISEGDGKYVIDADTCIDCGTCAATCPTGAIEG